MSGSRRGKESLAELQPGPRKLTLSCSRCRAGKLKCDRKEPCLECVKRNIAHLCAKDERQPRAKRVKRSSSNIAPTSLNYPHNEESEVDDIAQVLDHFVDGTSGSGCQSTPERKLPFVAPDYLNSYWSAQEKGNEKFTLIQEIVESLPERDVICAIQEVFLTRCQGALGNVIHTTSFKKQAETLVDFLGLPSTEDKVLALAGVFSLDALACHLLALVLGLAFHPTPNILGWSATRVSLRVEELRALHVFSRAWLSLALRCLQGKRSLFCGSIASLQAAIMLLMIGQDDPLELDTILVTAISAAQKLGLHRLGGAKLETAPLSAYANKDLRETSMESPQIRTEVGIRIWWALVVRDWSRGQMLGYHTIHSSQFNTRLPLHINDEDLESHTMDSNTSRRIVQRPRSEFTMLSYTVQSLEIALMVHESIRLRSLLLQNDQNTKEQHTKGTANLKQKYEKLFSSLPSHFRLGSTVGLSSQGPEAAIPVHRWMLHQQLWNLFLRLHRGSLSSQNDRSSCQLLAQHIISTEAQIQERCTVCSTISTGSNQLVNAATVLVIDLLFPANASNEADSVSQLGRLMARDKIQEAVTLLDKRGQNDHSSPPYDAGQGFTKPSTRKCSLALQSLMELEKEQSNTSAERNGRHCDENAEILKRKVKEVLELLEGNSNRTSVTNHRNSPLNPFPSEKLSTCLPVTTGTPDLDVLPLVSNDPDWNFWQFFDFSAGFPTPSPGTDRDHVFPTPADVLRSNEFTPFTPSSTDVDFWEAPFWPGDASE